MADLCFLRALLLDPFAPWAQAMQNEVRSTPPGRDDKHVIHVLQVPHATVSAVILTRDSNRTIRQCIEALQGAVDEIIVVDTGSVDDTVSIVESLGLGVHRFEWCDDFSAARNFGLSFVTSDWVISVDSDEILVQDDRAFVRQAAGLFNSEPFMLQILQMNRVSGASVPTLVPRMFKASGFTWQNPIHEQPVWKRSDRVLNSQALRIRLLHEGYDSSVVNITAKFERNIAILRKALTNEPENASLQYYLGREYLNCGSSENAVTHLQKSFEAARVIPRFPILPDICMTLAQAYQNLGLQTDAMSILYSLVQERPEHPNGWYYYGIEVLKSTPADLTEARQVLTTAKTVSATYRGPSNWDSEIGMWKANYMLGQVAQASGNMNEAIRLFREVVKVNPNASDAAQRLRMIGQHTI